MAARRKETISRSNVALMVFGLSDFHSGKVIKVYLFIFATALIGFPLILNVTCEHWSKFDAVLTAAMSRFSRGFPFCDLSVGTIMVQKTPV